MMLFNNCQNSFLQGSDCSVKASVETEIFIKTNGMDI
jgi:hypothetical protein